MTDAKRQKHEIIAEILRQSVYQPDSGLVEKLTMSLVNVSRENLEALSLILEIKLRDAQVDWRYK